MTATTEPTLADVLAACPAWCGNDERSVQVALTAEPGDEASSIEIWMPEKGLTADGAREAVSAILVYCDLIDAGASS
jgi:hypothetical protein